MKSGSQMGSQPEDSMKPPDLDLESGSAASPEVQETRFHAADLSTGWVNGVHGVNKGINGSVIEAVTKLSIASSSRDPQKNSEAQAGDLSKVCSALDKEFPSANTPGFSENPAKNSLSEVR